MDARPQRPMRTLRVLNDENVPPEQVLPKTIHQRNKSSPALTSTASMRGAKRTAFGDVSNIVAAKRTSKDDSSVAGVKGGQQIQEKKSSFLRPAQRPPSLSGLRNFLTGNTIETVTKIPLNDDIPPSQQQQTQSLGNTRKILSKRNNTAVFKDTVLDTVQEDEKTEGSSETKLMYDSATSSLLPQIDVDVTQLDKALQLPPPLSSDAPEPTKSPFQAPSEISLPGIDAVKLDAHTTSSEADVRLQPTIIPQQTLDEDIKNSYDPEISKDYIDALPILQDQNVDIISQCQPEILTQVDPPVPAALQGLYEPPELNPQDRQEPEGYWEEEYEETYDEEGYVTARSFRSRGDDTTGGATMILCPSQHDTRALRELEAAKLIVEASKTIEDYEDEGLDTSMVAEYGDEIFEYMRQQESRMMASPYYMEKQHEIQWSMRAVLMDWLVQVHHRFTLLPETLFLCVNYIDRFLTVKVVSLSKLQLVGATALFIAAKYEEINCPSVQEIVYMVDGGYSVDEILKAERFMLTMLQFELGFPGPMSFLRRISKADDYDLETRTLAKYFLEVTLMDERFIGSPPSFTAAASHCLARKMLRKGSSKVGDWTPHHVYYSGYTWTQLKSIVQLLLECCEDPQKHHQAVFNKYCDKRYKRASAFVQTEVARGFSLEMLEAPKRYKYPAYQQPIFASNTYYT